MLALMENRQGDPQPSTRSGQHSAIIRIPPTSCRVDRRPSTGSLQRPSRVLGLAGAILSEGETQRKKDLGKLT